MIDLIIFGEYLRSCITRSEVMLKEAEELTSTWYDKSSQIRSKLNHLRNLLHYLRNIKDDEWIISSDSIERYVQHQLSRLTVMLKEAEDQTSTWHDKSSQIRSKLIIYNELLNSTKVLEDLDK